MVQDTWSCGANTDKWTKANHPRGQKTKNKKKNKKQKNQKKKKKHLAYKRNYNTHREQESANTTEGTICGPENQDTKTTIRNKQ